MPLMINTKQFMVSLFIIIAVSMVSAFVIMEYYPEPILGSMIAIGLGGSAGLYYQSKSKRK